MTNNLADRCEAASGADREPAILLADNTPFEHKLESRPTKLRFKREAAALRARKENEHD